MLLAALNPKRGLPLSSVGLRSPLRRRSGFAGGVRAPHTLRHFLFPTLDSILRGSATTAGALDRDVVFIDFRVRVVRVVRGWIRQAPRFRRIPPAAPASSGTRFA